MIHRFPARWRRASAIARLTSAVSALAVLAGACSDVTNTPGSAPPSLIREVLRTTGTDECQNCLVGPVTLTRTTADPQIVTYTFAGDPAADYILDVTDNGSRGLTGSVKLNGVELVTSAMLGGNGGFTMHQPVTLAEQNTLEIRLAGKPGATMSVKLTSGVKLIGPEGGTIRSPGGTAVLTVPPGAVSAPVELTVAVGGTTPTGTHPSIRLAAPVIQLGPTGTQFAVPVSLTLRPADAAEDVLTLGVSQFLPESGYLMPLAQDADAAAGHVAVTLSHFSKLWLHRAFILPYPGSHTWAVTDLPSGGRAAGSDLRAELEADVRHALDQWAQAIDGSGIQFAQETTTPADAFITIRAMSSADAKDTFRGDPLQNGYAGAAAMVHFGSYRRLIIVNDDPGWFWHSSDYVAAQPNGRSAQAYQWERTILHELGHVAGRHGHLNDFLAIMSPAGSPSKAPAPLSCADINDRRKAYLIWSPTNKCAYTLEKAQPEPTAAVAGLAVPGGPVVIVRDRDGDPMPFVPVIFYVPVGSPGTVTGGMQYTDSQGKAVPTAWMVGGVGSTNQLVAKVELIGPPADEHVAKVTFTVTATDPEVLVFSDDFSSGLGNWVTRAPGGGSWWTSNNELFGDYNIGCGSSGCPHVYLLLSDTYQLGDQNWRAEIQSGLTQSYCCYNGGAITNVAKFGLWVSDSEKEAIEVGAWWQGLNAPTSADFAYVSHQRYPWTWVNSPSNFSYPVTPWTPAQFQTATLTKQGNEYIVTWNGEEIYRVTRTFSSPPKISFKTYGGVRMDNFKLYRLP